MKIDLLQPSFSNITKTILVGAKTTNPAVVVSELDESLPVLLKTYLVLPATWFKCSLLLKSLFKDNISSMALYSLGTHNASTSITFARSLSL